MQVDTNNRDIMGISKEFRVHPERTEATKKEAVLRVLSGELRKHEAKREYKISGNGTLNLWIERYGHGILSEHKELLEQMGRRPKEEKRAVKGEMPETDALRRRVKQLERDLDQARLRAEAYSLMIDLAEKELKVAIRKKSGTK
jgi:transposase-like protein